MKTTATLVLMFLFMDPITAIRSTFEAEMKTVLEMKKNAKSAIDLQNCADSFLELQNKYESEWLPSYYAVNCYLAISMEYVKEKSEKDKWIIKAKSPMSFLTDKFSNESEVWVLQSWYYAAFLMVDPMTRGMSYGQKSSAATQRALGIDPNNPRAQYLNYQNILGRAPYTGEDSSKVCVNALNSLQKFDDYPIKSDIYPSWGKEELMAIVNQCKY